MRIVKLGLAACAATLVLAGCGSGGIAGRERPDEFAVTRNQPLVIPPDYALTPPRTGEPVPVGTDARTQALDALFGGPAPRSEQPIIVGEAKYPVPLVQALTSVFACAASALS